MWGLEIPQLPEAGAVGAAEDEMVKDRAVERLGGSGKSASGPTVAVTRPRVPARMIVSEHDAGTSVKRRVLDDFAQGKVHRALVAFMARDVEATGLIVDVSNPKAFPLRVRIGDAAGEEGASCSQAVDFQGEFGTLIAHARLAMAAGSERPPEPNRQCSSFGPCWMKL